MRSLKEIADALWAEASTLKQTDRGSYDAISALAGEVHEHWDRLKEAVGPDEGENE